MSYYKEIGDKVIFDKKGYELVYIIPEKYFETSNAQLNGEYVDLMGLFYYAIVPSKDKLDITKNDLKIFKYPTLFKCKPYMITKVSNILPNKLNGEYRLLRFKNGDELMSSTYIIEDKANIELFFKMILGGRFPHVPEDIIEDMIIDNMKYNGAKYDLNIQVLSLIKSELCRDPHDISRPFRLSNYKDNTSYKLISITEVGKYMSPFVSITSENFDEALMGAVLMNDSTDIVKSPLETVFTGV